MGGKKKATAESTGIEVPIKWYIPDNIVTRYATNVTVQLLPNEFKVSFFEIKPKINLVPSKTPPKEVQADCVASVIINPNTIPQFIEALQGQYARFIEAKSKIIEDIQD